MNLITSGVMCALTDAASNIGLAAQSMSVYHQAKGDAAAMDRAAGYAAQSMGGALRSGLATREALEKAQQEAREARVRQQKEDASTGVKKPDSERRAEAEDGRKESGTKASGKAVEASTKNLFYKDARGEGDLAASDEAVDGAAKDLFYTRRGDLSASPAGAQYTVTV
jgi:hypothetical protein